MKPSQKSKPFDRKDVFFRTFKEHYGVLLGVSLAMFVFALPVVAVYFGAYIELSLLGEITLENAVEMYSIQTQMYIWLIPAFAIFSVGAAGAFYVIRRLVWDQPVLFFRDFFRGIKANWLQSLISGVIFILFMGALNYAMNMLVLNVELGSAYWTLYVVQIFLAVVAAMLLLFQYAAIAVYNDNVFKIIKNSFAFLWATFPRSIGIVLLAFAPVFVLLAFASVYIIYIIVLIFLALVGFAYGILVFTLHAHYVFDKYVNKQSFPDVYKKGLYHEGTTVGSETESSVPATEGYNIDVE